MLFSTPLVVSMLFWGVLLFINVVASILVARTFFLVKHRRYLQIVFIWVVPFLGAFMAIYFNYEDWFHKDRRDEIGNHPDITESEAITYAAASNYPGGR